MLEAADVATGSPPGYKNNSDDLLLSLKGVSKKFCKSLKRSMFYGLTDLSSGLVGRRPDTTILRKNEFWAVDNMDLELRRGQVLGLIGENGCGKTTLMRLIAGIFPVDKGEIRVRGRLAALISLGAGFHRHLTGRENIYLNGTILGMSLKEIDSKVEKIIEFAGIGDFINSPVSTYSSGMKVRLGFSIAVAIEPDVLILDEVLAVGDRSFKAKCYNEIDRLASKTAILFVSHQMEKISRICTDILVMDKGKKLYLTGNVSEGIDYYFSQKEVESSVMQAGELAYVEAVKLSSSGDFIEDGNVLVIYYQGSLTIDMEIFLEKSVERALLEIDFTDSEFNIISASLSELSEFEIINGPPYKHKVKVNFEGLQFCPGKYYVTISVNNAQDMKGLVKCHAVASFFVKGDISTLAPIHLMGEWKSC